MNLVLVSAANETRNKKAATFEIFTAVLCSVSFWLTVLTMLGAQITVPVIAAAVILPIILYLCGFIGVFGKFDLFYTIMAFAVCLLLGYSFFSKGFVEVYNLVADALNSEKGLILIPFVTEHSKEDALLYETSALILLVFLTSAFIASGIRKKRPFLILVSIIVPIILGLLFNLSPKIFWLSLLIISLTAILIISSVKSAGGIMKVSGLTLQMALSLVLFLSLFMTMFSTYSSLPLAEKARNYLDMKIEELRYAPDMAEPIYSMPAGDLNNIDIVEPTGSMVMTLELEHPSGMYLRSFIGEQISDNRWSDLDVSAYTGEYLGLIEYLSQEGLYPFAQLGKVYAMDSNRTGSAAKSGEVTVYNNLAYSDRLLVPYEVVVDENLEDNDILNTGILSNGLFGEREYTFTTYGCIYEDYSQNGLDTWLDELSGIQGYDSYIQNEAIYRSFVYDNYLDVPSEYEDIVNSTEISALDGKKYKDIVIEIREYFDEEFEFSYELDLGDNPLEAFATDKKSGHDPLFASYATLLFRSAGVPARYVEGYYLASSEMEAYASSEDVQIEVYDSAAHAWTEIYINELGWVPVEVTPGYYLLEEVENEQVTVEKNKFTVNNADFFYEDAGAQQTNDPSQFKGDIWETVINVLVIVIVIALLLTIGRFIVIAQIKKRIAQADSANATRLGYKFLIWDLKRKKIVIDVSNPYTHKDASVMLGDEYVEYLNLVYKEFYSLNGLSKAERKQVSEYVLKLVNSKKSLF